MKPESEWIVYKDAHPAIIDRGTFNLIKTKSKESKLLTLSLSYLEVLHIFLEVY